MLEWLEEKPGLLYVLATLLPIVSFGLLLVAAAVRWSLRPYAKDNAAAKSVMQLLGGEVTGRGPAYVALAAIALAFVCSAAGFALFLPDAHEMHALEAKLHSSKGGHDHAEPAKKPEVKPGKLPGVKGGGKKGGKDAQAKKDAKEPEAKKDAKNAKDKDKKVEEKVVPPLTPLQMTGRINDLKARWSGSLDWARIYPAALSDANRGTVIAVGFRINMLSAIMFLMVTFIATLIHLFSIGYMAEELQQTVEDHEVHTAHGHYERRGRFGRIFMFLSLFCFSMLNLILTDNLFQIFVSWELVGICSYLLVGFYFERTSASNAANKAFIVNRVGDAGFIIGLMIVWTYFGTLNFEDVFARIRCPGHDAQHVAIPEGSRIIRCDVAPTDEKGEYAAKLDKAGDYALIFPRITPKKWHGPENKQTVYDEPQPTRYGFIPYWLLTAAGLGIFLGCVGKSAQFPLQVWLPDAMEGPTPVGALIHAATMVAAGVYLVGRFYPMFTPEAHLTIAYVGAITLFVAASVAVVMTDIKKVLAYSTVSQLGYMMLAMGVGAWTAGQLHLLTHAFFKALLFLGSGSVIYGCHHQQDMLKMGGLYPKMKITAITMLIGTMAISGFPLFSGWYSKDEILAGAFGFASVQPKHFLLFALPLATAGITTFYMFRMWFMTFTGTPRNAHVYEHAEEPPWMMTVPLILLAIMSVCVAWGWPLHQPEKSQLGHELHHYSQPKTISLADFLDEQKHPIPVDVDFINETRAAVQHHAIVGYLALGVVGLGLAFALTLYFYKTLDPADGKDQFPGVHRFLTNKWYFDEVYSALIVRPGLVVAHWCRNFDTIVIDGFVNLLGRWNVLLARLSGRFDRGIIDGLANLIADVSSSIGYWLSNVQTGYLRSYILFLAIAGMALWTLLYAWARVQGGGP